MQDLSMDDFRLEIDDDGDLKLTAIVEARGTQERVEMSTYYVDPSALISKLVEMLQVCKEAVEAAEEKASSDAYDLDAAHTEIENLKDEIDRKKRRIDQLESDLADARS